MSLSASKNYFPLIYNVTCSFKANDNQKDNTFHDSPFRSSHMECVFLQKRYNLYTDKCLLFYFLFIILFFVLFLLSITKVEQRRTGNGKNRFCCFPSVNKKLVISSNLLHLPLFFLVPFFPFPSFFFFFFFSFPSLSPFPFFSFRSFDHHSLSTHLKSFLLYTEIVHKLIQTTQLAPSYIAHFFFYFYNQYQNKTLFNQTLARLLT